jgi:hypothetical protein
LCLFLLFCNYIMRNDSFPPIEYTVSSDQMLILKNKRMGE